MSSTADDLLDLLDRCDDVPGFLDALDAALFLRLAETQVRRNTRGHLLEIGAWYGKSAIVLGSLKREDEELHVCDLFETPPPTAAGRRELGGHDAPSRAQFEAAYERIHGELPVVHQCASSMLSARELGPNQFRFIHLDGSHRYEAVLSDIALARELAADECVIVFDDFSNLGHLGVAAAVWPSIVSSEVEPFACTPAKLYATPEKRHAAAYREAVETFASEHGNEIRRTDFFGSTSVTATWPAPPSLRERLVNRAGRTLRSLTRTALSTAAFVSSPASECTPVLGLAEPDELTKSGLVGLAAAFGALWTHRRTLLSCLSASFRSARHRLRLPNPTNRAQSKTLKAGSAAFVRVASPGNLRHQRYSARVVLNAGDQAIYTDPRTTCLQPFS